MNTFEIITLAEEFKKVNNQDVESTESYIKAGQFRIETVSDAKEGFWEVYVSYYVSNKWERDYICTKNSFSMTGAISEAIDAVIEHIA